MTDTILKGTGNSRTLRTVPTALTTYPTHEAMIQAMINGTFPIDLGGLQTAGLDQKGNDLNKATLLKDATAALFGKTSAATPDEIFQKISDMFTKKAGLETGTYKGTGAASFSLKLSAAPKALIIVSYAYALLGPFWWTTEMGTYMWGPFSGSYIGNNSNSVYTTTFTLAIQGNTVTISDKIAEPYAGKVNRKSEDYFYIALS